MASRLNPIVFLKGLRAAQNRFITPRKLMDISRSVFGKDLTPEQARDHLAEVEAELRPLYSSTLWLLSRGNVREGSVQEVASFCRKHQTTLNAAILVGDGTARDKYIRSLVCRFPDKRFADTERDNPWLGYEKEFFVGLFDLDPNKALPVAEISTDDQKLIGDLKRHAKCVGLSEIPAHVVNRMQRDFVFILVLEDLIGGDAQRFIELLTDPKAAYSFEEAIKGLGSPLNNFGLNHLYMYRQYKINREEYEGIATSGAESLLESAEREEYSEDTRARLKRSAQVGREICPHMDEIIRAYGLDFEVDKLPEVFFYQGYRVYWAEPDHWGDPGRADYYLHQIRSLLFITGILMTRYGYSHREIYG